MFGGWCSTFQQEDPSVSLLESALEEGKEKVSELETRNEELEELVANLVGFSMAYCVYHDLLNITDNGENDSRSGS